MPTYTDRATRTLKLQKAERPKIGNGLPPMMDGFEGENRIQMVNGNPRLYYRANNSWYFTGLAKDGESPDLPIANATTLGLIRIGGGGTISSNGTYTATAATPAADDITTGDAATTLATSAGAVLIDSQASTTTIDGHAGVVLQGTNTKTITMGDGSSNFFVFNQDSTPEIDIAGNFTIDCSGNITIDADGGTITFSDAGSGLGTITSSGYSGVAAVATAVTITDNENTNENNAIIFTAGGDLDGGNLGLESDGDLHYNPSTGLLTTGAITAATVTQTSLAHVGSDTDKFIVSDSDVFKYRTGAEVASDIGLGSSSSPQFSTIELGHATDTTIARSSGGVVTIEGATVRTGTVGVATGGTGATDTPANGTMLMGDGSVYVNGAITEGNGITVGTGSGSCTLSVNNNLVSGKTEITSGLADADEMLYSDAGTLKRVGLDTLKSFIDTNQQTTFTLTADSGSNQTIAQGNTLDIAGGTGISTVVGNTDTVTVSLTTGNVSKLSAAGDPGADRILGWDDTATDQEVQWMTTGDGLSITGTTLNVDFGDITSTGTITSGIWRSSTAVEVEYGGTGATSEADARVNLGITYSNIGTVDISSNTNLSAGTNISLSGDTLNVDDAFLINSGNDTTSGTITAAGFTTTGSVECRTIDYSDGDNAITIADGGGCTFPQAATFSGTIACGEVTSENGAFWVDTDDESGTKAGFKKTAVDRIDVGWGGSYGGNMEMYSRSYSGRQGEFRVIFSGSTSATTADHADAGSYQIWWYDNNGNWHERARFDAEGNISCEADVTAFATLAVSDIKFKENIKDIKYGLSDVLKMRSVDFDWKENGRGHDIGFIAQEMEDVVPEIVKEVKALNGKEPYLTVSYSKIVPILVQSIKELKSEIDELKKEKNG